MISKELERKVAEFGLTDVRKLAPIGNLSYVNGWEDDALESKILHAAKEQGFKFKETSTPRGYHKYYCAELCFTYEMDSSD